MRKAFIIICCFLLSISNLQAKEISSKSINFYDYTRGLFVANHEKKPVIMSFCIKNDDFCNKLHELTYSNPEVNKIINESFVIINVNGESRNLLKDNGKISFEKDLTEKYSVSGYPSIIFLNSKGEKISGSIKGYIPANKLLSVLKYISSDSYKKMSFNKFIKKNR